MSDYLSILSQGLVKSLKELYDLEIDTNSIIINVTIFLIVTTFIYDCSNIFLYVTAAGDLVTQAGACPAYPDQYELLVCRFYLSGTGKLCILKNDSLSQYPL